MSNSATQTAQAMGNIAQTLNGQAFNTYTNFVSGLPTITQMSNSAYGFTSAGIGNINATVNGLAMNVLNGVNTATATNAQNMDSLANQAPGQYQSLASNAGGKK